MKRIHRPQSGKGFYNRRRAKILSRDACICYLCGNFIHSAKEASVDHIVPEFKGGAHNDDENLAASHTFCNHAKGTMSVAQFREMAKVWASHRSKYDV